MRRSSSFGALRPRLKLRDDDGGDDLELNERSPSLVDVRELDDVTWLVRGVVDVASTMEWLAEDLLVGALKA
jgi:hypothetical protein